MCLWVKGLISFVFSVDMPCLGLSNLFYRTFGPCQFVYLLEDCLDCYGMQCCNEYGGVSEIVADTSFKLAFSTCS